MGEIRTQMQAKDRKCMAKAIEKDELTFTLVEHDKTSPRTVAFWIMENIETAPSHKLHEALEFCLHAREHANRRNAD
jgi:hypothetical protein